MTEFRKYFAETVYGYYKVFACDEEEAEKLLNSGKYERIMEDGDEELDNWKEVFKK